VRRTRQAGWTLIELMVTVAIIAVLAAIGIATLQPMVWRGRVAEVATNFKLVSTNQETYFNEFGEYVGNGWAPVAPVALTGKSTLAWPTPTSVMISGYEQIGYRPDKETTWHAFRMVACPDVSQAPCVNHPCGSAPLHFPSGYAGPGFIMEAQGDVNGDGVLGVYCATSRSSVPIILSEDWPGQNT